MFKDIDKHLREGRLSRRELFSTAGKVGVGAAAASMAPMSSVLAAPARDDFPPRKVLWLTMVRVCFFVPVAVGQAEAAAFYGWDTQFNAPESYTVWPGNLDEDNPSTWGHMEFPSIEENESASST